jgi:acyl carrier protein
MADFQKELIDFIKDLKGLEDLSPDDSLLESRLIKSFDFIQLLMFIEEKMQVKFEDQEIDPDNFETVSRIVESISTGENECMT